MGLFDALLSQEGVNLTGGGLVGAPDDKLMETRFDETGNAYQADVRIPLHAGHTKANQPMLQSPQIPDSPFSIPESPVEMPSQVASGLLGKKGIPESPNPFLQSPVPQSSFMPGSQELLAQGSSATIAPWSPEQTNVDDARQMMSSYKAGERRVQDNLGSFQDLTPNADPSQAMQLMEMYKKEGKAISELEFEGAMNMMGMSDVLKDNRSQMNNIDESLNTLMNDNTNDFGEQVSADSFGQSDYDLNQQRQDTLDGLMMQDSVGERADNSMAQMHALNGTTPNVIPEPTPEPTFTPDPKATNFWNEGAERDFNIKQGLGKAKEFGSDAIDTAGGILGPIAKSWYGNLSKDAERDVAEYNTDESIQGLMGQNLKRNIAEMAKGGVDAAISPVETADAIASLVSGTVQHALPDDMAWNEESKDMASAVADIYAERYGSLEGFKKALSENPAEVLLELTGAGLITKVGAVKLTNKLKDPKFLQSMAVPVERVADKALEMASLGTIKDGGRMNIIDDGVLGQTPKDPMIVQHNLRESALIKQAEGGLPMPSIAVSKVNSPLEGFGEISLIGHPDLVKPSRNTNTYPSDIYSGRAPADWLEYKDPDYINSQIGQKELDWYKVYDVSSLNPGALESKMAFVGKMEGLGYNKKDYNNYQDMELKVGQAESKKGNRIFGTIEETLPSQMLGETRSVMTNPKGSYTPSGSKRDPVDYSPELALKDMRKRKAHLPAKEDFASAGQMRALTSQPFKNMSDIKANRHKIADGSVVEGQKSVFQGAYQDATYKVEEIMKRDSDEHFSEDSYEYLMQDIMAGRDSSWAGLPESSLNEVRKITEDLRLHGRGVGTEYFESKPNRLVPIGEFKGAIIPDTAKEAQKILEDKGVKKILKYGSDEERIKLFKEFNEVMFAKIAIPAGGLIGGEDFMSVEAEETKPPLYTEPDKPMTSVLSNIKKPKVVRNVRSNNPGNIKDFGIKWDGMTGTESGGSVAEGNFVVFDNPENGIRALTRDLTNKRKRGLDTITKILNKYAPNGKENDTKSYIKDVARDVGIGATDKLSDKNMFKMIKAITKHEGGKDSLKHFSNDIIKKGMKSSYKNKYQKFK